MEVRSLYQRGLRVAPCIPDINDEWDPPIMKCNLSAQLSKCEVRGGDAQTYPTELDDTDDSFLKIRSKRVVLVSHRTAVEVNRRTLFSSEGILSRALADGDEGQSALGNFRSASSRVNRRKMSFGRSSAVYIHQQALSPASNQA